MMPTRCLILACGNTLRGDDGVGPWLAEWAENTFRSETDVRVLARQQWTPELAEDIAHADSVLFVDASLTSAPGSVGLSRLELRGGSRLELSLEWRGELRVGPAHAQGLATHHLGAPELLALADELFNSLPRAALLLTIGTGSTELGEAFSDAVAAALPAACRLLEETVLNLLGRAKIGAEIS
jgi:Ni,Fe-hydrogenase maturation factor